jgi:hypothetical protein
LARFYNGRPGGELLMAKKFAEGRRAWGICARSGAKALLSQLIPDGRFPNLRVLPEWWEPRHPLEFLPKVEDPIALRLPSPEVIFGPTAPVLSVVLAGGQATLTWSPAESDITEIRSYTIFRGVDGATPMQLIVCAVQRDFLGGIIGVQHCTTTPTVPNDNTGPVVDKPGPEDAPITYVDTGLSIGHTYCYYVSAQPLGNNQSVGQGPASAPSNTVCVSVVPTFFRLLETGSYRLLEDGVSRRLLEAAP